MLQQVRQISPQTPVTQTVLLSNPFVKPPTLFPSPLRPQTFFGFWVLNLALKNKEISKVSCLCTCPYFLTNFSLTMHMLRVTFILVVFSLTKGPTGHLGTIFRMLIVSDGRGTKKKEGEDLRRKFWVSWIELSPNVAKPCSGSCLSISSILLLGVNPVWP